MNDSEQDALDSLYNELKRFERTPMNGRALLAIKSRMDATVEELRRRGHLESFDHLELFILEHGNINIVPVSKEPERAKEIDQWIRMELENYNSKEV